MHTLVLGTAMSWNTRVHHCNHNCLHGQVSKALLAVFPTSVATVCAQPGTTAHAGTVSPVGLGVTCAVATDSAIPTQRPGGTGFGKAWLSQGASSASASFCAKEPRKHCLQQGGRQGDQAHILSRLGGFLPCTGIGRVRPYLSKFGLGPDRLRAWFLGEAGQPHLFREAASHNAC